MLVVNFAPEASTSRILVKWNVFSVLKELQPKIFLGEPRQLASAKASIEKYFLELLLIRLSK